jgi:hypothetical protein
LRKEDRNKEKVSAREVEASEGDVGVTNLEVGPRNGLDVVVAVGGFMLDETNWCADRDSL